MHVLRLLRIFIPLLIVAAIVAGTILVLTSRSELKRSHQQVESTFTQLRAQLDERYQKLSDANQAVIDVPGPLHELVADVTTAYANWKDFGSDGGVTAEVDAANKLESLGRRLVQAARKAPRLADNKAALALVNAFAALPAPSAARRFDAMVDHFEQERNRPARKIAAQILGYDSIPTYDAAAPAP
jgi:hypothetical protein